MKILCAVVLMLGAVLADAQPVNPQRLVVGDVELSSGRADSCRFTSVF
jgi:hypothetical protein